MHDEARYAWAYPIVLPDEPRAASMREQIFVTERHQRYDVLLVRRAERRCSYETAAAAVPATRNWRRLSTARRDLYAF